MMNALRRRLPSGATARVLACDAAAMVGAASVTFGCWSIYQPAGYIMGGAMVMIAAISYAIGNR